MGTQEQEQQVLDMKLQREGARAEAKQHELDMQQKLHESKQRHAGEERQAHVDHLARMRKELGLTAEQLSTYMNICEQGKPAKLIQILGGSKESAGVHLHEGA